MVKGQTYGNVTPPTNANYTYVGYAKTTTGAVPSIANIVSGSSPPAFTYTENFNRYHLILYYQKGSGGTINVRHMVRTGSTGSYAQAGTSTIAVASLPNTQTVSPTSTYGNVVGSSISYGSGYSDTVSGSKSQSVSLTASKKTAYVSFFYEREDTGVTADFDIVPSTVKYGESFKYKPKDVEVGSCTYKYITFRTMQGAKTADSDQTASMFTPITFADASKYPSVVTGPGTYEVMMLVKTACGDTWVGPKTLTVTSDAEPEPSPEPAVNNPPYAVISFYDRETGEPTGGIEQGKYVDLKIDEMKDPDGDTVTIQSWDFSDWINDSPPTTIAPGYSFRQANALGQHTVYLTVADSQGLTYTAKTSLTVLSGDPIAAISGAGRVKEGRTVNPPIESKSYSPLGYDIVEENWTNKATSYPDVGEETVTLWVKDERGRSSEVTTHTIEVIPDEPPVITLDVPEEETRLGTVTVKANAFSTDSDQIASIVLEMKYDSNNNGFADDTWTTVQTGLEDTYSFKPSRIGKYLFRGTATEDYGKTGNTDSQPEAERTVNVLNLAPTIDVVTSSSQTGMQEKNLLSMTDLYNTGTIVSLDTYGTGTKANWLLQDGMLTTKTYKTNLHSFRPSRNDSPYPSYLGTEIANQSVFASIQNTPSITTVLTKTYDNNFSIIADEKYTYVLSKSDKTITAYNSSTMAIVWSKTFSIFTSDFNVMNPFVKDNLLIIPYSTFYLSYDTTISYWTSYIVTINRETGDIISGPVQTYRSGDNSSVNAVADDLGIIVPAPYYGSNPMRYSFDLVNQYSYASMYSQTYAYVPLWAHQNSTTLFNTLYKYNFGGYAVNVGSGGDFIYNQDGTAASHYDTATNNGFINQLVGTDSELNYYAITGYNPEFQYLTKLSPQGTVLSRTVRPSDLTYTAATAIGVDSNNNFVFTVGTSKIKAVDAQGNSKYEISVAPESGMNAYQSKIIIGSDGLVSFIRLDRKTSTNEIYVKLIVYDPDTGTVIRSANLFTGYSYTTAGAIGIWSAVPNGDQSIVISAYANSPSSINFVFKISASGSLTYPKQFEIGTPSNDMWIGTAVDASDSVSGDLISTTTANASKGVGYMYRVQDSKNYYSAEFEAGKLVVKKTVGGTATTLNSKSFTLVRGNRYTVKFVPTATGFSVYVNRIKQFDITDGTWTSGKYGLINRGQDGVRFGNVETVAAGAMIGFISGVVLVDGTLDYDVYFDDPETDPRITAGESWTYTHNPNVFLNSLGTWTGSGSSLSAPMTTFSLPGEYTFTFKTKDDPNSSYLYPSSVFSEYREESNEVTGRIRVHRKPIAVLAATVDSSGNVTYTDDSYDPDRYNPTTGAYSTEDTGIDYASNHGAVNRAFRYRSVNNDSYIDGKPTQLPNGTFVIEEAVQDEYGAWSDWAEVTLTIEGAPALPPNPGFYVLPETTYRGEAVLIDSYANDPVDGSRENLVHAWYIRNVTTAGAEALASDSRTTWEKVFNSLGIMSIRQLVTNSSGLSAEVSHTVSVINRPPTAEVTTPASADSAAPTLYRTLKPAFMWSYADADGDAQNMYQLQVYSMSGTLLLNSNTLSGTALTWTATANLPENTTMYVMARVYDGYDWSEWSSPKYFKVLDSTKPVVTITTPSSTSAASPTLMKGVRPEFVWTYYDKDGDPEQIYRVQVYRASDNVLLLDSGNKTGDALSWTATADLPKNATMYVRAMAYDGLLWSDWSEVKYFKLNSPPTGDFTWTPTPVYEGDTVNFIPTVDDPDGDALTVTFTVTSPSGTAQVFSLSKTFPYDAEGPNLRVLELGVWTVKMIVSDGQEFVTVTKPMTVLPLGVTGFVRHTEAWEANRLAYNEKNPGSSRPAEWFWAGEAFVLEAATTDTGSSATKAVEVTAEAVFDSKTILGASLASATPASTVQWKSLLGSKEAGQPLSELSEGLYTFIFTAKYSNGTVKTAAVTIRIVDQVGNYVQVHRIS
ncbi:hypothetical protein [Cohnella fermenti]|nr:hypothetical protein [Cohnella fermenti]